MKIQFIWADFNDIANICIVFRLIPRVQGFYIAVKIPNAIEMLGEQQLLMAALVGGLRRKPLNFQLRLWQGVKHNLRQMSKRMACGVWRLPGGHSPTAPWNRLLLLLCAELRTLSGGLMSRVTLDLAWHKWRRLYAALFSCGCRPCYVTVIIMSWLLPASCLLHAHQPTTAFAVLYFCILLASSHCVGQQLEQWGTGSDGNGDGDGEECMLSALLSCLCNCAVVKGHTRGHMSSPTVCCCAAFYQRQSVFHFMFYSSLVYKLSQWLFHPFSAQCVNFKFVQITRPQNAIPKVHKNPSSCPNTNTR